MTQSLPKPLIELEQLVQIADPAERLFKLDGWMYKWLVVITQSQSVLDRKHLSSEFEDELRYALATKVAEELIDKCITLETQGNEIKLDMLAFKRIAKVK